MLTPPPKIYPFHAPSQSSPPAPFFLILLLLVSSLVFARFLWVVSVSIEVCLDTHPNSMGIISIWDHFHFPLKPYPSPIQIQ